ncbi:MAG: type IV secretory system conjugative DNA transfer family protein [Pyrinomonadaceae bacterium]
MPDYSLHNKDERSASALVEAFSLWEKYLRGWQVWDYAVSLEPAFSHVKPPMPQVIVPINDDARVQGGFHQLFGRNTIIQPQITGTQQLQSVENQANEKFQPIPFYRTEKQATLSILLPEDLEVSPVISEQFFLSLGSLPTPISFEVLADNQKIILQFVCDESSSTHLKTNIKIFFPSCYIAEQESDLASYFQNQTNAVIADFGLAGSFLVPLQTFRNFNPDPLTGLISSMSNLRNNEKVLFQILFQKTKANWSEEVQKIFANSSFKTASVGNNQTSALREKLSSPLFAVVIRLAVESESKTKSWEILRRIGGNLNQFSVPSGNELIAVSNEGLSENNHFLSLSSRTSYRSGMLLNVAELASLAHLPSNSVNIGKLRRNELKTKPSPSLALNHSLILGENIHQGRSQNVTLSNDQRTKHLHLIGSSGSGKSTLLLNLIKQDLQNNQGFCVIDPHGDLIDAVIENVPDERLKDVILFDPSDAEFPIGFNILQANSELEKNLLSSDLVATFRQMATSWGDVMDSVLANAILAFVESSRGGTLFDLRRFLVEKEFRAEFLQTVSDESVRYFWSNEFPQISGKPQSSILIRLDSFMRNKIVRNIVCQKQTELNFRQIMDNCKIFLIKLSQGLIGKENAYLLGTLLVSKLYQTALSRQNSTNRPYFWIYLDEFHHFITPSMESILSGVRKYNIGLHLAHQEFRQLQSRSQEVASSVLSNCYTRICFRLGDNDAERFAAGFSFFDTKALQNLGIGEAVGRCERAEYDFNLKTSEVPKVEKEIAEHRKAEIIRLTREQFARPKAEVEANLMSCRTIAQDSVETKAEKPVQTDTPKIDQSSLKIEKSKENVEFVSIAADNSHRYLQNIIKRIGENNGFVATLEKRIFGGIGKVDIAPESETLKIACEVAVTNTVDYELQNIQKCLASGFDKVVVISDEAKHLANIKKKVETIISTSQFSKVYFLEPENFHLFLEKLRTDSGHQTSRENKVKGYKVNISFKETKESDQEAKEQTIAEILKEAEKRKQRR